MPNSGLFPKSGYKADTGLSLSLISLMAKFPFFVLLFKGFFFSVEALFTESATESTKRICEALI